MKNTIAHISFLLGILLLAISCASTGSSTSSPETAEVTSKRNISRVQIMKSNSNGNIVEFKFRGGRGQIGAASSGPQNITLQGNSGTQEVSRFRGFSNVEFPFEGEVRFAYTKQAHDSRGAQGSKTSAASTSNASVGIKIDEPGHWIVRISY
jgi:hypothetical protein